VDRNARRVAENHGFDGDWRLESLLTMGACLSRREDRVVFNILCNCKSLSQSRFRRRPHFFLGLHPWSDMYRVGLRLLDGLVVELFVEHLDFTQVVGNALRVESERDERL